MRRLVSLLALSLLCLLPSLLKPPHIDEESYLFIAQSIADHPLLPYDWWRPWQPFTAPSDASFVYAHPPFFLWALAAAGDWLGFGNIPLLRLSQWIWWVLLVMGVFSLASNLCRRPLEGAIAVLFSPALFLVGHQSLMIDLPTIALLTVAMAILLPALKGRPSPLACLLGGAVLGLATLTKYPALLLWIPILYGLRGTSEGERLRAFGLMAVPWGLLFLGWQTYTAMTYGTPHLLYVLTHAHEIARTSALSRGVGTLAHLGGTVVAPGLLILALIRRPWAGALGLTLAAALTLCLLALSPEGAGVAASLREAMPDGWIGRSQLLIFWALGIGFVGIWLRSVLGRRSLFLGRDGGILALWAGVMVVGVIVGHNFVGARYLALGAVPLGFLLWGWVEMEGDGPRRMALALSAALALGVAYWDTRWSRSWEPLVEEAESRALLMEGGEIYGSGEWTFRYLREARGWGDLALGMPKGGDVIVVARDASPGAIPKDARLRGVIEGPEVVFTVHNPDAKIGLYSDAFGFLPYGIGPGPLATLEIWQMPISVPSDLGATD